ncbi:MAG: putative toxin-antitoxin system toxin component, PIN family [Bryobacteraceae bacterium]
MVIDTNVVVSAVLAYGSPKAVLNLAFNHKFAWYVSEAILAEYETVFAYPRLKLASADVKRIMAKTPNEARIVFPRIVAKIVPPEAFFRLWQCQKPLDRR